MDVVFQDIEDLLVCGSCQRNFPLGNIINFMQHKKYDCADISIAGLMCQSCPQQFGTPWSLMKHAQSVHELKIYLETGPFSSGITEVTCYSEKQSVSSKKGSYAGFFSGVADVKSSTEVILSMPQQPVDLNGEAVMQKNSLPSGVQMFSACDLDAVAQDQFDDSKLVQSSLCSNFPDDLENMPPKKYTEQKNSLSTEIDKLEHISGDLTLQTPLTETCTEDTENVSGHSAVLEKCCSSVLPKKRKRHMEIKHGSSRKRAPVVSSGPTSIYIDLEPGSEGHSFRASVSHDSVQNTTTLSESESSKTLWPSLRRHSVIIQPGMTFSIPVSHASVSLAPSFDGEVVNSVTVCSSHEQISPAEQYVQASNVVSTEPTAAQSVTYQPVYEPIGAADEQKNIADESSRDGSSRDGFVDEEHGHSKTVEHKRRKYPTSRPFKCDQCDNAFNQRIHLKKHQSKHTGVKPFKCDQCDYSTVERSHLKVHIRVHTGEKPYKCTYCEYATAQNSTLKIHLRRHHHEPVSTEPDHVAAAYVCSKCGLQFEQRDMYQCHDAEQHTGTATPQSSISTSNECGVDADVADDASNENLADDQLT